MLCASVRLRLLLLHAATLATSRRYDLHVSKDANGLNTGSFYVRSSKWSRKFLKQVWDH